MDDANDKIGQNDRMRKAHKRNVAKNRLQSTLGLATEPQLGGKKGRKRENSLTHTTTTALNNLSSACHSWVIIK